MQSINFLSFRRISQTKVERKDKQLFRIGAIALVVSLVAFVAIFSTQLFFNFKLKANLAKQAQIKQEISSQENTELAFLIFSNKLKTIRKIYELRIDKQHAIDFFTKLLGTDSFISGMTYDQEERILGLQISSESVFQLEKTMDLINTDEVRKEFNTVEQSNLAREESGEYKIRVTVQLKTEGEKSAEKNK